MNIHKLNAGEVPYTCLPNDGINVLVRRDPIAFAIWGYLLSKPADWVIHPAEVIQTLGISQTKYRLAMQAPKAEGYALRTPLISEGHLAGSRLALCAMPNTPHDEVVNESQVVDSDGPRGADSLAFGIQDSHESKTVLKPRQSGFKTCQETTPYTKERSSTKEREENTKEIYIGDLPDFDSGNPPGGKSTRRQNSQPESQLSLLPDADSGKPKTKAKPKAKNSQILYTEEFEAFWKGYPNKSGKKPAAKTWRNLNDEQKAAIEAHLALKPYAGRAPNHIPHGSTYLSEEKWEDEVITTDATTSKSRIYQPRCNAAG